MAAAKKRGYLIVSGNGRYLVSGAGGKARPLTKEEKQKILPLIQERQKHGAKLAKALSQTDFPVDDVYIVDHWR